MFHVNIDQYPDTANIHVNILGGSRLNIRNMQYIIQQHNLQPRKWPWRWFKTFLKCLRDHGAFFYTDPFSRFFIKCFQTSFHNISFPETEAGVQIMQHPLSSLECSWERIICPLSHEPLPKFCSCIWPQYHLNSFFYISLVSFMT